MNARIRNKLIQVCRTGGSPISYRRLINQCELGLNMEIRHEKQLLGEILDEISMQEHKAGRPLLSAMVMDKKKGQGDRFFKLCEELGHGEWKKLKKDDEFREDQINQCIDFWQNDKNYKKYF
ncbi:MAG: hypothetical protein R3345_06575 [Fulvivirga sp.]|nr:hypothetical protein [Fulvivirga sp.]